jgi:hypothetical protein
VIRFALVILAALGSCVAACSGSAATIVNEGNVAAYAAEQIQCVTLAATRGQADSCRDQIKENWCAPGRPLAEAGACSYSSASVTIVTVVEGGAQ